MWVVDFLTNPATIVDAGLYWKTANSTTNRRQIDVESSRINLDSGSWPSQTSTQIRAPIVDAGQLTTTTAADPSYQNVLFETFHLFRQIRRCLQRNVLPKRWCFTCFTSLFNARSRIMRMVRSPGLVTSLTPHHIL